MKTEIDAVVAALPPQPLSQHLFRTKYALPGEATHADLQWRVAHALARDDAQAERFFGTQEGGAVLGGRINSAAGSGRQTTMINCFVQPIADTMSGHVDGTPGIMVALAEASETMRRGGGVGYDFSPLRPRKARVKGTDSEASGPVSYMEVYDRSCATVESAGSRRGAQMAVLRIDHPDIEEFIDSKKTPDFATFGLNPLEVEQLTRLIRTRGDFAWAIRTSFAKLSNFNISVGMLDAFMQACEDDATFDLVHVAEPTFEARRKLCDDGVERFVYRTVRARDLWTKIVRNAYETGDPGIIFLDTVNRKNNLWYCEMLRACNPCGEQFLPPYGCCDLGHQNLTRLVRNPFTADARFDFEALKRNVAGIVEILDRVIDVTEWPLTQQKAEAEAKRRIGVGFLGLANAMAMLGLRYGSSESAAFAAEVAQTMAHAAYRKSIELAKEFGAFPLFDAEKYLQEGTFASTLPDDIRADIRSFGIRNSHLLSIAPVGTGSLAFADNASSGIEPPFDLKAYRSVRTGNGEEREVWEADDYAVRVLHAVRGDDATDPALVTAQNLTVEEHLAIVQAVAPYMDSAISKTINVPREYSFEAFQDVYVHAWKAGLKGITCYRPNEMVGQVLTSAADKAAEEHMAAEEAGLDLRKNDPDRRVTIKNVPDLTQQMRWPSRPDVPAEGRTYAVRHPRGNFAVVVNHWRNGGDHPLEVYIAGNEAPRGLGAIAKSLSVDMRTDDAAFVNMKLDSLLKTEGDDDFEMRHPSLGTTVRMPSLTAGFALLVQHRLRELGALQEQQASPMVDALFSKREPKTGPEGNRGWHVDINNPATGDDFLLHMKELVLPDGTIRAYSVWLSGRYPKVLDGLMKVLSIDLRVSDPNWAAMKLRKLTTFGEVRGDFLAKVPGEARQKNYPSTVAYMAEVLLARLAELDRMSRGRIVVPAIANSAGHGSSSSLLAGGGQQCPECHTMSLHKVAGCMQCSHCHYVGSCG
ncbi:adenosylcobalamin-dependent ribonucleoside-diphosphate reductase [Caenimonas sedimenti]|uniref:Vitamin B12-dependent ribonucleotide reductase n=1 Tax=Caenimonas sedimenti TaxID=2596921 RepID=A0A562ZSR5_9BURK|nr:adenosylcobalamin-dependent ribonucleoside-diphosphate reductase [Caenimonas sedimenti]TWO71563.1 adenosylcobalamin-dependent ribonucleoside-diphosphate reductase [Caenimonas sedimenti]